MSADWKDIPEFIYLVPGNWFELRSIVMDKTHPFDMEMLENEIRNQINNRSDQLSFIDLKFGSKYNKSVVEEINFYLDQDKFFKMSNMLENEKRHPIITFHGTTNLECVNSILENGYIIPGTKNKTDVIIKKTHGSAYGVGVYSSPFFDKAMYYTTPDKIKYVYVLVNLVFLGVMKMVPPNFTPAERGAPKNGIYPDGSNTRIVYGLEQLVSANSSRVVPLAVMKIVIG